MDLPNREFMDIRASKYPVGKLFKPQTFYVQSISRMILTYEEVMAQKVLPTREDLARPFRAINETYYANTSFDEMNKDVKDWDQKGIYWVRRVEGLHANCWTNSRVGAHAWWRDADGSYCCAGFPYFSQEALERFSRTMEMLKPIIAFKFDDQIKILICLERTLQLPHGNCWGISTKDQFLRVSVGTWNPLPLGERIPKTKAALKRKLEEIIQNAKTHGQQINNSPVSPSPR